MPRTTPPALAKARSYWMGLSIAFGVGLGLYAAAPAPWHLVSAGAYVVFVVIQAAVYGQIKPALEGKLAFNSASFGLLALLLVVAAVVSRDSPYSLLLGIGLGVLSGVSMFWVLTRRGRFYPRENRG